MHSLTAEGTCAKLESVLGFSSAVQTAILTGKRPNETLSWTDYILNPRPASYWWENLPLENLPHAANVIARIALSKILKKEIRNIPLKFLKYFKFDLYDENRMKLFDIFLENKIKFINIDGLRNRQISHAIKKRLDKPIQVAFIKLPDLDLIGHIYGTSSNRTYRKVSETDDYVKKILSDVRKIWGKNYHIIITSDHGMVDVSAYINLPKIMKIKKLKNLIAFFDATIARFWFKNNKIKEHVESYLNQMNFGKLLSVEELKEFGINFPDSRYGQMIFLLNPGNVIFPNYYSVLPFVPRGMHGYDPKFQDMLGIFICPSLDENLSYLNVVDIFPKILELLDLS